MSRHKLLNMKYRPKSGTRTVKVSTPPSGPMRPSPAGRDSIEYFETRTDQMMEQRFSAALRLYRECFGDTHQHDFPGFEVAFQKCLALADKALLP